MKDVALWIIGRSNYKSLLYRNPPKQAVPL